MSCFRQDLDPQPRVEEMRGLIPVVQELCGYIHVLQFTISMGECYISEYGLSL